MSLDRVFVLCAGLSIAAQREVSALVELEYPETADDERMRVAAEVQELIRFQDQQSEGWILSVA